MKFVFEKMILETKLLKFPNKKIILKSRKFNLVQNLNFIDKTIFSWVKYEQFIIEKKFLEPCYRFQKTYYFKLEKFFSLQLLLSFKQILVEPNQIFFY